MTPAYLGPFPEEASQPQGNTKAQALLLKGQQISKRIVAMHYMKSRKDLGLREKAHGRSCSGEH